MHAGGHGITVFPRWTMGDTEPLHALVEQNMTLRLFPAAGSTCRTSSASAWAATLEKLKEGLVRLASALDEFK